MEPVGACRAFGMKAKAWTGSDDVRGSAGQLSAIYRRWHTKPDGGASASAGGWRWWCAALRWICIPHTHTASCAFVFANWPADRLQVVVCDSTGMWLCTRRRLAGDVARPREASGPARHCRSSSTGSSLGCRSLGVHRCPRPSRPVEELAVHAIAAGRRARRGGAQPDRAGQAQRARSLVIPENRVRPAPHVEATRPAAAAGGHLAVAQHRRCNSRADLAPLAAAT